MVRSLMLVAALVGSMAFAGSEAQAFGKRVRGQASSCGGQVVSYGTTYAGMPSGNQWVVGSSTPYMVYSTPYQYPAQQPPVIAPTVISSPTATGTAAALSDGTAVTLTQIGTDQFGRPVYSIMPTTAAPKKK